MSIMPLVPFAIAAITVILIIIINILDDKMHPIAFILALLNAFAFLVYVVVYNAYIDEDWFNYLYMGHIIFAALFLLIVLLIQVRKVLFFKTHYQVFLNSIKASKWNAYYVVDQKGRIKEMSDSILEELGFDFHEVKGKDLFEILNKSIRITNFDEVETNNRSLETYYEDYSKKVKKDQLDTHTLMFQNYKGKSTLLRTTEQPIYIFGRYRGRINIGEKRSDFDLIGIERQLKEKERELESLRLKYIATIELTNDGLYYIDLDERYMWASSKFLEKTDFTSSMIDLKDYQNYIYNEDLNSYLGSLSSLTMRKKTFKTRYRLMIGGEYVWVDDRGQRIFEDKTSNIIVGSLDIVSARGYAKVGNEVLDNIKTEKDIHVHLKQLYNENRRFQLALFELKNIPEINKEMGREIGDMLISEYVKKLMNSFMSESSEIFRISGLVFAVTILDPQKMQILKTGSTKNPKFLNMEINYGAVNAEVDVLLGVSSSYGGALNSRSLFEQAEHALGLTKHKNYSSNVCYYGDIDD